ncbi:Phage tail protein [Vibrio chagasii]|nr:Phage tail protein [Vibrio chagasii]
MSLLITEAGIAASVRASERGIRYKIAEISIGTQGYIPTPGQTSLRNEIQRKAITRGEVLGVGQLHFETVWDGEEAFEGKELGYWLDDGTLFAVDSRDGEVITYKQPDTVVTEACELNLAASTIENITVELIGTPSATETRQGIATITTSEQVEAGIDDTSILTVKKLVYALGVSHVVDKLVSHLWLKLASKIFPVGAAIPWFGEVPPNGFAIMKNQTFDTMLFPELAKVFPNGIILDMRGCGVIGKEEYETTRTYEEGQVKEHGHPKSKVISTNLGNRQTTREGRHRHPWSTGTGYHPEGPYLPAALISSGQTSEVNGQEFSGSHFHHINLGSHAHQLVIELFGGVKNTINHRKVNWIVRMA